MRVIIIPTMQSMVSHIAMRLNHPCMFWGPAGCGKTEAAAQAAANNNAVLCDIRISQYEAVDFRGMPSIDKRRTVWNLPSTMPFVGNDAFPDDRPILLVFDEINSGQDDVMAVCYQIIQERRAGEHVLKPNVRVIAMGNREGDRGVTRRMPHPLSNRFTHAEIRPDAEALVYHLASKGVSRLCLGFLLFRKNLISTFDPASPEKSVASPRTWEKAFTYWMDPHLPEELRAVAISGAVGEGPAGEFLAWTQMAGRVVSTQRIINDPRGTPLPEDEGMCWATVMNISGDMTRKNVAPLATYLDRIGADRRLGREFQIAAWHLAGRRDETLTETDAFMDFSRLQQEMYSDR